MACARTGGNPFFIEKVFETFANNADVLAHEAHFEVWCTRGLPQLRRSPMSAAKYRELFGGR